MYMNALPFPEYAACADHGPAEMHADAGGAWRAIEPADPISLDPGDVDDRAAKAGP
jgi:hypothetical protein